jgi:hypothetical protein
LPATRNDSTTAEVSISCTWKGKPRNYNLIPTAIVEVKNESGQYIPCRALLDSASQSHFITEKCAQLLKLSTTQTPASVGGISNVNTATQHSVSLQLRSRHTDWHTAIYCAILPNITGATPSIKLNTSSWNIPKDMKLADEHFNYPGGIDILICADLSYEMLLKERRTHTGNYPILQETVLGWTISGETPSSQHVAHNTHSCFEKPTIWLPRRRDPTQGLGLHLVKVPSLQHCQHPHHGGRGHRSSAAPIKLACNRGQHHDRHPGSQTHFLQRQLPV